MATPAKGLARRGRGGTSRASGLPQVGDDDLVAFRTSSSSTDRLWRAYGSPPPACLHCATSSTMLASRSIPADRSGSASDGGLPAAAAPARVFPAATRRDASAAIRPRDPPRSAPEPLVELEDLGTSSVSRGEQRHPPREDSRHSAGPRCTPRAPFAGIRRWRRACPVRSRFRCSSPVVDVELLVRNRGRAPGGVPWRARSGRAPARRPGSWLAGGVQVAPHHPDGDEERGSTAGYFSRGPRGPGRRSGRPPGGSRGGSRAGSGLGIPRPAPAPGVQRDSRLELLDTAASTPAIRRGARGSARRSRASPNARAGPRR